MAYIGRSRPVETTEIVLDNFVGDSSTTDFVLGGTVTNDKDIFVTVNGVTQHTDVYSIITQDTLRFAVAPATGDLIEIRTINGLVTAGYVPLDNTLSRDKLNLTTQTNLSNGLSLTHNFASDADYTLTSDENTYGRLILTDTGVLLTTARNVIVSDLERNVIVQNDTAQILTIKTSAGTGVSVNVGDSTELACDGTNVIKTYNSLSLTKIKSNAVSTAPVVQDSAGTEIGQYCKAWVNFNGTGTVAINDSFNVSSITDNGVGDYTVNLTNAMPNANYGISGDSSGHGFIDSGAAIPTISNFRVGIVNAGGTRVDSLYTCYSVFSN